MSKIIDAVSIVLTCENEVFAIQRQNFLKAFPGYWAFPGGKVEKDDAFQIDLHPLLKNIDNKLFAAVVREGEEELGINIFSELKKGNILKIDCIGCAVTPDFNPLRFATYFFKIKLKAKPHFKIDSNEAKKALWMTPKDLLALYHQGEMLAVPPVIKVIESLDKNIDLSEEINLNFHYDSNQFVPYIESIKSVRQIMPLSHTLPPAIRTNAFLIGDGNSPKILIDPSPIDSDYEKFKNTINQFGIDGILLTHHHPDHHENSPRLAKEYNVPIYLSAYTKNRLLSFDHNYFDDINLIEINEGSVLTKWLDQDLLVFEIPGHDEGQVAVAPRNMNWFLAGDLFQGIGTVVIGGDEGDMAKYFHTLEKVITLNPKVVFPSHGIALGGVDILERTLEHRKVRENQIFVLYNEGKNEEEMLDIIYSEIPVELKPFAMKNIRKHLEKLEVEKKISRD